MYICLYTDDCCSVLTTTCNGLPEELPPMLPGAQRAHRPSSRQQMAKCATGRYVDMHIHI